MMQHSLRGDMAPVGAMSARPPQTVDCFNMSRWPAEIAGMHITMGQDMSLRGEAYG